MAYLRLSRPDSGLAPKVRVRKTFEVVPSSLGSAHTKWAASAALLGLVQGYLAHKKQPPPLGPPRTTIGPWV